MTNQGPTNESLRLNSLRSYGLLDSPVEKSFDDITFLASQICETPISLINLIDESRQWFKSFIGIDLRETPREVAVCNIAIETPHKPLIIEDMSKYQRTADNPFVTGDPKVRFYAGVPICSPEGYALGTLCVIDTKPRTITEKQLKCLKALADQTLVLFENQRYKLRHQQAVQNLELRNQELERFAHVAAHDLKSPLSNIMMISRILENDFSQNLPDEGKEFVAMMSKTSQSLREMIDGILAHAKSDHLLLGNREEFSFNAFIREIFQTIDISNKYSILLPEKDVIVNTNKVALQQIMFNLITNAIKYNQSAIPELDIHCIETPSTFHFTISDNGVGIAQEELLSVFNIFESGKHPDRFGHIGTGVGLSTVKNLLDKMQGEIQITSEVGKGTKVTFVLPK
jgi:K+-sensing histidine kinase KdpD